MRSRRLLIAALAACFLLASCATSLKPATELQKPLPAEYQARCPAPPPAPPESGEVDPVANALKAMYDLYGLCAGRTIWLLNWIDGERPQ